MPVQSRLYSGGDPGAMLRTQIGNSLQETMLRALSLSAAAGFRATSKQLDTLSRVLVNPRKDGTRLTAVHQAVGKRAQQAVLNSYAQTVTARKQGPSYRIGDRQAGGALRRAIADPAFFRASAYGIDFINTELLDKEASHWHRLNFGAAPRGEGSTRRYDVRWGGLVAMSIGFNESPSAPFGMPAGFWITAEGARGPRGRGAVAGGQFYVAGRALSGAGLAGSLRRQRRIQTTHGIVARHFLEAGLEAIATRLPGAYQDYYREIYQEATRSGTGPLATIKGVVRPAAQTVSVVRYG